RLWLWIYQDLSKQSKSICEHFDRLLTAIANRIGGRYFYFDNLGSLKCVFRISGCFVLGRNFATLYPFSHRSK
ncbi:hypothetical protein QG044_11115, partial [Kingella kingae]|uniref:hypothetical protein n=1 Tax=Kingella kingae TaxID=504 RepID=UPI00254BE98C